jgi:N-acetylneuraminic acid mutarotase
MNEPRTGHTATLLSDGRVLVIGGCAGVCDPREHDDWAGGEIYDPATDSWTRIRDIPVKREGHTATLLRDGRVLVVGGSASIWPAPAQMYDPATDAWRDTPEFLINRVFHTATRLVDGRVLVVGGDTAPCIVGPICVFELGMQPEIYDPTQNTWTPIDGPSPRDHVATLLKSGQVLVSGGVDWYADAVATANVYNPQTGTWTTVNSMQTARYAHTATLLKNGRVLVVGGYGDNGVVSTAELYKSDQSRHGAIR